MKHELKAYWDEESKSFKEYNDEFDLTIHFETEEERDKFIKTLENYDKLKEAVGKIKAEIEETDFAEFLALTGDIGILKTGVLNTIKRYMEGLV